MGEWIIASVMELKVWVDGVQRIVCGVTEFTTCQEVVIALAQAIGTSTTTTTYVSQWGVGARLGSVSLISLLASFS